MWAASLIPAFPAGQGRFHSTEPFSGDHGGTVSGAPGSRNLEAVGPQAKQAAFLQNLPLRESSLDALLSFQSLLLINYFLQ